jgi:thiamine pyrophosphate-dependent acetolactate synthase large subunit-like protein
MLGLGMALAQPGREVIAFNGDGGMLMGLGCLVTVTASGAKNFTLIVLDNGLYEVTGGQPTAGVAAGCDFVLAAKSAKFTTVERYDHLDEWKAAAGQLLKKPGPRFVQLSVEPVGDAYHLPAPTPITERIKNFSAALG